MKRIPFIKCIKYAACAVYLIYSATLIRGYYLLPEGSDSFGTGIGLFMFLFMVPALIWLAMDVIRNG